MYNLDLKHIIQLLLPPFMRQTKITTWLNCLIAPLLDIYGWFLDFRTATLQKLSFTGQVIYLEKLLNDTYNGGQPGIYISDVEDLDQVYVGNRIENAPIYIGNIEEYVLQSDGSYQDIYDYSPPIYIGNETEFTSQYDFIIHVPSSANVLYAKVLNTTNANALNEARALVDTYKLAGKNYTFITIP